MHAAKHVSLLLAEVGDAVSNVENEGILADRKKMDDASEFDILSSSSTQPTLGKGLRDSKSGEDLESVKRRLTEVDLAFASKAKAMNFEKVALAPGLDNSSDEGAEVDIDEFLRMPMRKILARDDALAKSLRLSFCTTSRETRTSQGPRVQAEAG